jgi:hypothetical protein
MSIVAREDDSCAHMRGSAAVHSDIEKSGVSRLSKRSDSVYCGPAAVSGISPQAPLASVETSACGAHIICRHGSDAALQATRMTPLPDSSLTSVNGML